MTLLLELLDADILTTSQTFDSVSTQAKAMEQQIAELQGQLQVVRSTRATLHVKLEYQKDLRQRATPAPDAPPVPRRRQRGETPAEGKPDGASSTNGTANPLTPATE